MSCFFNYPRTVGFLLAAVVLGLGNTSPIRADLITNLEVHYTFDGNGADSSGNSRDVSLFGGVGFASGLFGQALDLHANNSQFAQRAVNDPVLNFGAGDFTIQTWFNFNSMTREQTLIEKFFGGGGPAWSLTTFPNHLRFGFDGFAGGILDQSVSISTGTWNNVTVRRSGNTFDLFFNGANVDTATTASSIGSTTEPLLIGKRSATDGRDFSVDGRIDEVAIWTRALSNAEVATLYNSGEGYQLPATTAVPEPTSMALLGLASLGGLGVRWRNRRKAKNAQAAA